jgi:hypothetical protein
MIFFILYIGSGGRAVRWGAVYSAAEIWGNVFDLADSLYFAASLQEGSGANALHCATYLPQVAEVMPKMKGQTFQYRFGNETKTFLYCSRICLVENRLFRFGPESALLDKIEMISFDGADSGTNSGVLVSVLLDDGTFVEHLWNVGSCTVLT